jgi:hypothetical protein
MYYYYYYYYYQVLYRIHRLGFRIWICTQIQLDPHSICAWIRDPDPYSDSGFRIQMSKIGLKSQYLL